MMYSRRGLGQYRKRSSCKDLLTKSVNLPAANKFVTCPIIYAAKYGCHVSAPCGRYLFWRHFAWFLKQLCVTTGIFTRSEWLNMQITSLFISCEFSRRQFLFPDKLWRFKNLNFIVKQTLNAQMGLFIQSFHIFIAQVGPKTFVLRRYFR